MPFPGSHIQAFARQLLGSIAFLHDLNLIHTDLKPEIRQFLQPAPGKSVDAVLRDAVKAIIVSTGELEFSD